MGNKFLAIPDSKFTRCLRRAVRYRACVGNVADDDLVDLPQ
ncbi:hypothetical protein [Nostoc sp.]